MGMATNAQSDLDQRIDNNINDWVGTYKHLTSTRNSRPEKKRLLAGRRAMKKIGYE